MEKSRRQADSQFDGLFAYEVLRRIIGDAGAKRFLLTEYQHKEGGTRSVNVELDGL